MTPLHWANLMLYFVALILVLVGVATLGDSTASCFMDVTTPPEEGAPTPVPVDPPLPAPDQGN